MRYHLVDQRVVIGTFVAEAEFGKGRPFLAEERAGRDARARYHLFEQLARWRRLQIFDDVRLDAGVADHRQRVARRSAIGIMVDDDVVHVRSEEHTSELQSLMRISYAVFCLKKKKNNNYTHVARAP